MCRPPHPEERDMLCEWRIAFEIEILGASDSEEHWQRAAKFLDAQIAERSARVVMSGPVLVTVRLQRQPPRYRATGRHLHTTRVSRARLCQGCRRGLASRGPRPRGISGRLVHEQSQRCPDLRSDRIPANW